MPAARTAHELEWLVRAVLDSEDPWTLDLPPTLNHAEAKTLLSSLATDDAWRAYDLVHQLATFGRAF